MAMVNDFQDAELIVCLLNSLLDKQQEIKQFYDKNQAIFNRTLSTIICILENEQDLKDNQ